MRTPFWKGTLMRSVALALAATASVAVPVGAEASSTRASYPRPGTDPTTTPKPPGIFSEVGGWIAYGDDQGIWAVDPSHPGDPEGRIQLSTEPGTPVSWSSDGSKLLILRHFPRHSQLALSVLNADGTETLLVDVDARQGLGGGSFSPDGSKVVYASGWSAPGIYVIDADGGTPRLLLAAGRRWFPSEDRSFRTLLGGATFSPDGSQIAYVDGMGDWGNSLRVMDAHGSGSRVLLEEMNEAHIQNLGWSPDGSRLAFASGESFGIYVVGADGSGLTVVAHGRNPYWSPDGSRISYQSADPMNGAPGTLEIAASDGTHVEKFGYAASGPWNPLVQRGQEVADVPAASEVADVPAASEAAEVPAASEVADVPAASEGMPLTSTLLLVVPLLALIAGAIVVLIRRRMVQRSLP